MTGLLAGVLAVLLMSQAATVEPSGVDKTDEAAWSKFEQGFGARLMFTDKPDELFAAWNVPSPDVAVSETLTAVRGGKPIVGVIFFTGCKVDAKGNCKATVRFTVERPDGKPWGEPIDGEFWMDKPAPGSEQIQLAVGNLGLIVEPKDALGPYKVKAVITDQVAGRTMVLERSFTAVEAPK